MVYESFIYTLNDKVIFNEFDTLYSDHLFLFIDNNTNVSRLKPVFDLILNRLMNKSRLKFTSILVMDNVNISFDDFSKSILFYFKNVKKINKNILLKILNIYKIFIQHNPDYIKYRENILKIVYKKK